MDPAPLIFPDNQNGEWRFWFFHNPYDPYNPRDLRAKATFFEQVFVQECMCEELTSVLVNVGADEPPPLEDMSDVLKKMHFNSDKGYYSFPLFTPFLHLTLLTSEKQQLKTM